MRYGREKKPEPPSPTLDKLMQAFMGIGNYLPGGRKRKLPKPGLRSSVARSNRPKRGDGGRNIHRQRMNRRKAGRQ